MAHKGFSTSPSSKGENLPRLPPVFAGNVIGDPTINGDHQHPYCARTATSGAGRFRFHLARRLPADQWKEGEKIKGLGDPPLKPGTALATFKDGKYENKESGNHAVVFKAYKEEGGRKGMVVIEQARNTPAREKFIPFSDPSGKPIYQAENYSVVRRP